MANSTISIPTVARELEDSLQNLFCTRFGSAMTIEIPHESAMGFDDQGKEGEAHLHFPMGIDFKLSIRTGIRHYGRFVEIISISLSFKMRKRAAEFYAACLQGNLALYEDQIEWRPDECAIGSGFDGGKLKIHDIEGRQLELLREHGKSFLPNLTTLQKICAYKPFKF